MADLGAATLGLRAADRRDNREAIAYTIAGNSTQWSVFNVTLPADILEAVLLKAVVLTDASTTAHVTDYTINGEVCMMDVTRGGPTGITVESHVSTPIRGINRFYDVAPPRDWAAQFEQLNIPLRGGDLLYFYCPPADDNAAPTGDYAVRLVLKVVLYSKR